MAQCPVETCTRDVDTTFYVMCDRCWETVPGLLQKAVYKTWAVRCRAAHLGPPVLDHDEAKRAAIEAASFARIGAQERLDL